jgi:hypothetical protein
MPAPFLCSLCGVQPRLPAAERSDLVAAVSGGDLTRWSSDPPARSMN